MKTINTKNNDLKIPAIGIGCMRLAELKEKLKIRKLIEESCQLGINFFDHADIYANGESERLFGECIIDHTMREKLIIQTKCGIRPGVCYDFSKSHILSSVDNSLQRLKTDYLDILILHRPDTLMEPEEVAEALEKLEESGKVRYFGVSNMNPGQIALLDRATHGRIIFDQIQFSLAHCDIIDSGINFNINNNEGINRDGGLLEYARINKITLQAWSPFQYGMFEGTFIGSEKYPQLNALLNEYAKKYDTTPNAVAVAWIMRHPAEIQTIIGTTNINRIKEISKATQFKISREEWYKLYLAAGKLLP